MHRFTAKWNVAWLGGFALVAAARLASPQTPPAPASATKSGPRVAITGVTVIDVATGAHQANVSVLIQGDRITSIGPRLEILLGATRVNGKGKFLIPGLWDMHSHHQGTGAHEAARSGDQSALHSPNAPVAIFTISLCSLDCVNAVFVVRWPSGARARPCASAKI